MNRALRKFWFQHVTLRIDKIPQWALYLLCLVCVGLLTSCLLWLSVRSDASFPVLLLGYLVTIGSAAYLGGMMGFALLDLVRANRREHNASLDREQG